VYVQRRTSSSPWYALTLLEGGLEQLRDALNLSPGVENAAYLICKVSRCASEVRLLVREGIPVEQEHILEASAVHMKIASISYRTAMKRADSSYAPSQFPTNRRDERSQIIDALPPSILKVA
jgi:hypothetical protein